MTELVTAVDATIRSHHLLHPRQSVLVAVSGGVDSMVLLHVLNRLAKSHSWRLVAAHFNHRLRGRASNADEAFVKRAAESLGLQFVSGQADVRRFARKQGLSLEMAARRLRHDFLAGTCSRLRFRTVALAHHADDQVELFFLRLLRGAGSEGLCGMDWTAPSPSNPAIRLVRPLLGLRKDELRAFAQAARIAFREDATNAGLEYPRNRIRHALLPLLRDQYQPGLNGVILRVMEVLRREADFVSGAARRWMESVAGGVRDRFDQLHVAVQRRVLQSQLLPLEVPPEFELIERLRTSAGEKVTVNPQRVIWRDELGQIRSAPPARHRFDVRSVVLDPRKRSGDIFFDGVEIRWKIQPPKRKRAGRPKRLPQREQFDARRVGRPILLRHWRPGDRFQPIGMRSAVKVQDLFVNAKVPRAHRHKLVLATTAQDEIFWIEGFRISERFKLDAHTGSTLEWRWQRGRD